MRLAAAKPADLFRCSTPIPSGSHVELGGNQAIAVGKQCEPSDPSSPLSQQGPGPADLCTQSVTAPFRSALPFPTAELQALWLYNSPLHPVGAPCTLRRAFSSLIKNRRRALDASAPASKLAFGLHDAHAAAS